MLERLRRSPARRVAVVRARCPLAMRASADQPVQRAAVEVMEAERLRDHRAMVPLPDAVGPSMAITGAVRRQLIWTRLAKALEIIRKGLAHAFRVVDAHRHAAERCQRKSTSPCGGRRRCRSCAGVNALRRRDRQPVRALRRTVAPSLRSSVAIAAMRSVSFTRQLAILRRSSCPCANKRHHGGGHRRVGNVVAVAVDRRASGRSPLRTSIQSAPSITCAPMRGQRVGKSDVALDAVAADAFHAHRAAADARRRRENTTPTTRRLPPRSRPGLRSRARRHAKTLAAIARDRRRRSAPSGSA